jgi:hypothetical protein
MLRKNYHHRIINQRNHSGSMKEKYGRMTKPDFYCRSFIEKHNNLPKYQTDDCKKQCDSCVNEIIDHHAKKIIKT